MLRGFDLHEPASVAEDLWNAVPAGGRPFDAAELRGPAEPARRYIAHAIAPGTPLSTAVRLRMHGQIKLKDWAPFSAQQVIAWDRGMAWQATVRMNGLPVRGFDRFVDGQGVMRWRLLGIIPVMAASGPDITRSAAGRVTAESVWLPSVLCGPAASWTAADDVHAIVRLSLRGTEMAMTLAIDGLGRLQVIACKRWGNPGGGPFRAVDFGEIVDDERTFGGYTIPSRLRIGWYIGTDRFEREEEFFRVTIDNAEYW